MSKDDRLNKQIDQFYEQVPEVPDAHPMKDYLLKHENNQMAWYLLGKQYMARGETAKANYCFRQAGPVYEAFEEKANPLAGDAADGTGGAGRTRRRRRGVLLAAGGGLLLALGLLLAGDRAHAPTSAEAMAPPAKTQPGDATAAPQSPAGSDAPPQAAGKATPGGGGPQIALVAGASEPAGDGRRALGELLLHRETAAPSLLVETPVLGKWTDWQRSGRPLAQVRPAGKQAAAAVDWFAPGWCPCNTAQDGAPAAKQVRAWKPLQEGKLMLRSAVVHYKERTGKWPSSLSSLAGAYPNNAVAGTNEALEGWFKAIRDESGAASAPKQPDDAGWPSDGGPADGQGKPAGRLSPLTERTLEIRIDKTRHRLAVVAGDVLLRNYAIGIGAKDTPTPEGSFEITEKVRNPNGRADGAFGSRGMTLSDTLYAIHGTDEPDSIGKSESLGCIRMKREDLEELYDLAPLGTKVTIAQGGLPSELRAPAERFRLKPAQDETNPRKTYKWLN
ncbi:L,D-transpeptidase [Cohnella nanjingensis]|uniref:L,D-transpeptidase family protein n=1 Tax=Cohnella nanjingensis TaxID=1387779 RepID=A0A7X0RVA0_9BACL|nr:L,D-transpeptidase [Cohnella nanjingensis]MBB6674328.1 L,D-transpeptidase family protein [Cohnella nanjingensis]